MEMIKVLFFIGVLASMSNFVFGQDSCGFENAYNRVGTFSDVVRTKSRENITCQSPYGEFEYSVDSHDGFSYYSGFYFRGEGRVSKSLTKIFDLKTLRQKTSHGCDQYSDTKFSHVNGIDFKFSVAVLICDEHFEAHKSFIGLM